MGLDFDNSIYRTRVELYLSMGINQRFPKEPLINAVFQGKQMHKLLI
jgi:hypothetical protein